MQMKPLTMGWLVTLLFLYREGDTLTNADFLYKSKSPLQKGNCYSVFRASPVSVISQSNRFKTIFMPKRHILGWRVLPPQ